MLLLSHKKEWQISYEIINMCNLVKIIQKILQNRIDSKISKPNLWLLTGKCGGEGELN